MARAFWKGAISFGLVTIPCKMYVATGTRSVPLHLLHKKCLTRPNQVLFCKDDNEYFTQKETVRGYEVAEGRYVVLTDEDFENVPVKTAHTIEINSFVNAEEIDPLYFYDAHYIEPDDIAAKAYCVLRDALRRTGQLAIAKVSFQRREHLCALRPSGNLLVLHTMHYHDEMVSRDDIDIPERNASEAELSAAETLIKAMVRKFDPAAYHDAYREALQTVIDAKLQGEKVAVLEMPKYEEVPDLMSALRASIEAAGKESPSRSLTK